MANPGTYPHEIAIPCAKCGHHIFRGNRVQHSVKGRFKGAQFHAACTGHVNQHYFYKQLDAKRARDLGETTPATTPTPTPKDAIMTNPTPTPKTPLVPTTPPAPGSLEALLLELIRSEIDQRGLDPAKLQEAMQRAIDEAVGSSKTPTVKVVTHTVVLKDANGNPVDKIEGAHPMLAEIMEIIQIEREAGNVPKIYLHGEAGTGKSTLPRQVAQLLGVEYEMAPLAPQSLPSSISGFVDATGKLVETSCIRAFRDGLVLSIEEVDNTNDGVLTSMNAMLSGPVAQFAGGLKVPVHKDTVVFATGNTIGLGGNQRYLRRRQDGAFRDRFTFLEVGYDAGLEMRIAMAANPEAGAAWAEWCWAVREWSKTAAPEVIVGMRAIETGARLLRGGKKWEDIASWVVLRGSNQYRDAALRACPVPKIVKVKAPAAPAAPAA